MWHARDGRYGLLQEGGPGRARHPRDFNGAIMLRARLFAERHHRFDRNQTSAPVYDPILFNSSVICPTPSLITAHIASYKVVR